MFTAIAAGIVTTLKLVTTGACLGIGFAMSRHIIAGAELAYMKATGGIDKLVEEYRKNPQEN